MATLRFPRIDEPHAAVLEIAHIACGHCGFSNFRDGGDLSVEKTDWLSPHPAVDSYKGEGARRIFVEGKNTPQEKAAEHRFCGREQLCSPFSYGQQFDSAENFGHTNRRRVELIVRLLGCPEVYGRIWRS